MGELYAYAIYDSRSEAFHVPADSELLQANTDRQKAILREKLGLPPEGPFVIAGHFDRYPTDS